MENSGMPQLPPSAPLGAEMEQQPPAAPAMPQPPAASRKHIEVVAISSGFYDNHRKVEGDRFTVPSIEMTGSWMVCVDPKHERARQERLKAKRLKANTAEE